MARSRNLRSLIAEAAEWRLIGLLLERPRGNWHAEIARLGSEGVDAEVRAIAAACEAATEGDYLRLIGPGGLVSPREVTYQPFADPGQLLSALAVCYDAFAFRPHLEEPIDHIAVEVAFVGYLLLKQAFASARRDRVSEETTAQARVSFIETHLAAFAAGFAQRLEGSGPSYLYATARLLSARVPAPQVPERVVPSALPECGACGGPDAW